ncbi:MULTISPECIES: redoxin domain-containing protein [unclassified Micromonospora]|uniref:redoxin domain-containing protein n=1 Tax=unclassified Micromonospora TaxID=2617518 RepID=UPI0022B73191|nr:MULTISPECIES: redoxin domain-containing protein [unclassified Micromonospora]MCZ7476862.1 redoxin domain-containing protein [Micromonospora sp. WMMC273]WBC01672.1 redoxin domain-containing protein [Micromonospora sp. WMMA1976]
MSDPNGLITPGTDAPGFTLPAAPDGREVGPGQFRGRPVVLAFYPADWSPVCGEQMTLYQAALPELERYDAVLLGISVDSVDSHRAFAESRGIRFPLLADFEPKGEVSRRYGAYAPHGQSDRALVVIGPDGRVAWSHLSPPEVNPGVDGILDALARLDADRRVSAR